jgi:hypothetical protein
MEGASCFLRTRLNEQGRKKARSQSHHPGAQAEHRKNTQLLQCVHSFGLPYGACPPLLWTPAKTTALAHRLASLPPSHPPCSEGSVGKLQVKPVTFPLILHLLLKPYRISSDFAMAFRSCRTWPAPALRSLLL